MSMFSIFRRYKAASGIIGYLGLTKWWFCSLTEGERRMIRGTYKPMGGCDLEKGKIAYSEYTPLSFLSGLARWFLKDQQRSIAYKILDQASNYLATSNEALDVHFFYQTQIEVYYRDRSIPEGLERTILACQNQIAFAHTSAKEFKRQHRKESLPSHKGYTQLAIILEGQKRFQDAIELCGSAKKNGWCGDWDQRIARCLKSLKNT